MDQIIILLTISALSLTGAELPVQVVPQGIESVNGSDVNMGCTSPLVDSGGVMVCNSTDCPSSYLLDGNSPAIDTSTSNWASQLVTVRKNDATHDIPYDHVVLTFGFDTAVSPTLIELDLFLCPEWNIGAPFISVYADEKNSLVFNSSSDFIKQNTPSQTSCDSHSTITISFEELSDTTSPTWHIVVTFAAQPDTEWVHVGEVRFLGTDSPPVSMCTTEGPSSSTTEGPSLSTSEESTVFLTAASAPIPSSSESVVPSTTVIGTSPIISTTTIVSPTYSPTNSISVAPPMVKPPFTTITIAFIAATIVGLIMLIFLILIVIICCCKSRKQRYSPDKSVHAVHEPDVKHKPTSLNPSDSNTERSQSHPVKTDLLSPPNKYVPPPIETYSGGIVSSEGRTLEEKGDYVTVTSARNEVYFSTFKPTGHEYDDVTKKPIQPPAVKVQLQAKREHENDDTDSKKQTQPIVPPLPPMNVRPNESEVTFKPTEPEYDDIRSDKPIWPINPPVSEVSVGAETVVESTEPEYEDIHSRKPTQLVKPPVLEANLWPNNVEASVEPEYDDIDSAKRKWLGKPLALETRPKMVEAPIAPLPSYSNVPVVNIPPAVAPKPPSPNHKTSLTALPPVIFSESISPSDFLCVGNPLEVREGMPPVFGAVYPILKPTPNTQPPVEISSDKVEEKRWLGTGKFGEVVLAFTKGLSLADMRLSETDTNRDISIVSVMKKLKPNPSTTEQEAFDKEVKFMSVLKHPNVVQFIGVCYQDPAFIIMEYMEKGDLNQFLQNYSEIVTAPTTNAQIAISTLVYMASQIASAMKYLAALNFIHRDLASRNCFVGEHFTIKLADISRNDQYQTHYYRIRSNTHLPIRWMATECFYGKFSEKSDVWAFGVTMWELFTLAREHPYPHLSDEEVIHNALNMEYRQFPSRPTACPQHIYEIMKRCWLVDLRQRNTFLELHQSLQSYN